MRELLLALAVIAGPVCAQDTGLETVAEGLAVSAPDMLMRAAMANCIAYDLDEAITRIEAAGWDSDTDDGGLTTLWRDEIYAQINAEGGLCIVSSPIVDMTSAGIVAGDLMTTLYGGTPVTEVDDAGCALISSDAELDDYVYLSSDGDDPTCENTGQGGSALHYFYFE